MPTKAVRFENQLRTCLATIAVALAVTALASRAAANDPDLAQTRANGLFEEGKMLLTAGDWLGACEKFTQSHSLFPSVSTLVKLARCSEHQGDLNRALSQYRDALQLNRERAQPAQRQAELQSVIVEEMKQLEPRIPRVKLRLVPKPPGLRVSVDGAPLSPAAIELPITLSPGHHDFVATAPGYRTERVERTLTERQQLDVELILNESKPSVPPASSAGNENAAPFALVRMAPRANDTMLRDDVSSNQRQRNLAWLTGGAGVASLAVAGYFGVRTLSLVSDARNSHDCNPEMTLCRGQGWNDLVSARKSQTIGFVLAGAGTALVGTGIVLYVTAGSDRKQPQHGSTQARRFGLGIGPAGSTLWGLW